MRNISLISVSALGCYRCSSINGSNIDCEDEFNAIEAFYEPNCKAARKSYRDGLQKTKAVRTGLYPATWCIKFKAVDSKCYDDILERAQLLIHF